MPFPTDAFADLIDEALLMFDEQRMLRQFNRAATVLLSTGLREGMTYEELLRLLGDGGDALSDFERGNWLIIVVEGRLLEVRSTCQEQDDEIWVVADKSEELRLQAQIAEQAHVLASANEAYLVVDRQGLIRYANAFCEEERGYSSGGMVGLPLHELENRRRLDGTEVNAGATDVKERVNAAIDAGGVHRYDAWHHRSDGSRFPVEISARPHRITNETVLLITARDESERLRFVQELMTARSQAEESNRAKSAFLAITSHELRTPLTAILAFTDLLLLDHGHDEQSDLTQTLRNIKRSGRSLLQLITDILDFAKIEGQTLSLEDERIELTDVVERLRARWVPRFKEKSVTLDCELLSAGGVLETDPVRLDQLLDNLVGNALKFSKDGTIRVRAELVGDREVAFRVEDEGPGIDIAHREKIFDPFYQAQDATTRTAEGTGLGLFICRQLAHMMGGEIELEWTELGSGTRFLLQVPRKRPRHGGPAPMVDDVISAAD